MAPRLLIFSSDRRHSVDSYLTVNSRPKCSNKKNNRKMVFGGLREISPKEVNVNFMLRKTLDWQPRFFTSETTEVYRYHVTPRTGTLVFDKWRGQKLICQEDKSTSAFHIGSLVCAVAKHASLKTVLNTGRLERLSLSGDGLRSEFKHSFRR